MTDAAARANEASLRAFAFTAFLETIGNPRSKMASHAAAIGLPAVLEILDQLCIVHARALTPGVGRVVPAKQRQRLFADAERPPIPDRAGTPRCHQLVSIALDRGIHLARLHDLVADQAAFLSICVEYALVENAFARKLDAGEARQP